MHRRATFEQVDTPIGPMETWLDVTRVEDGCVHMVGHNVFLETGEDLVVESTLRFRTLAQLTDSLRTAGFTVMHVYGDCQFGLVSRESRVMVFVALRR